MARTQDADRLALATFAGGCFWCVEAAFEDLPGVVEVTSGYTGGHDANPSYREVCSGQTGHAEAVQIRFDPARVDYAALLERFFRVHDPTQRDRQGADVGSQYRSLIAVHDAEQRRQAQAAIAALQASGQLGAPVVTEIVDAGPFYPAEPEHQGYFRRNPHAPYCQLVIRPKLAQLQG